MDRVGIRRLTPRRIPGGWATTVAVARTASTPQQDDAQLENRTPTMYLLPLAEASPFRFLPTLIFPVIAIAIIALGIYLVRHRMGKKRG
jgi:hypothetical protein